MIRLTSIAFAVFFSLTTAAQLQPGYDRTESMELLKVNFRFAKAADSLGFPSPRRFKMIYRSPIVGTDNCWDLWEDKAGTGLISIRGTTGTANSWLSNFYTAMVSATGSMKISQTDTFYYDLSPDPKAAVHVGWLLSTGCLMQDMMPRLQAFIASGRRDLLITGHSQGGAIAYLVTAHLRRLQQHGKLPANLRIKTYCSAAPKPGNLFFAYSYEAMTQQGWAFNTVNAADWVPETPFSVQTINDLNCTNPITDAKSNMKLLPFFARLVLKRAFDHLDRPTRKAQRRFDKTAKKVGKILSKSVPGYEEPETVQSAAYVRTGSFVVLQPDAAYYELFPDDSNNKFLHHMLQPYLYLLEKHADNP